MGSDVKWNFELIWRLPMPKVLFTSTVRVELKSVNIFAFVKTIYCKYNRMSDSNGPVRPTERGLNFWTNSFLVWWTIGSILRVISVSEREPFFLKKVRTVKKWKHNFKEAITETISRGDFGPTYCYPNSDGRAKLLVSCSSILAVINSGQWLWLSW